MIDAKTLQKVIDCYGEKEQIEIAIENCSKLISALQEYKRSLVGIEMEKTKAKLNVCDKIADVNIMVHQLYLIFDHVIIKWKVLIKMVRLWKSIEVKHVVQHKS